MLPKHFLLEFLDLGIVQLKAIGNSAFCAWKIWPLTYIALVPPCQNQTTNFCDGSNQLYPLSKR